MTSSEPTYVPKSPSLIRSHRGEGLQRMNFGGIHVVHRAGILVMFCLSGETCSVSPLRMKLAVGLLQMPFFMLNKFPCILSFLSDFIIKGCWILSKGFSAPNSLAILFISVWLVVMSPLSFILCQSSKRFAKLGDLFQRNNSWLCWFSLL